MKQIQPGEYLSRDKQEKASASQSH